MKKEFRIKKSLEIEAIMKNKQVVSTKEFRLYYKIQTLETSHFRYAISVGKKIGNAVTRNLYKRKLRALIYDNRLNIPNNLDIFIIVKEEFKNIEYKTANKQFKYLLNKIKAK